MELKPAAFPKTTQSISILFFCFYPNMNISIICYGGKDNILAPLFLFIIIWGRGGYSLRNNFLIQLINYSCKQIHAQFQLRYVILVPIYIQQCIHHNIVIRNPTRKLSNLRTTTRTDTWWVNQLFPIHHQYRNLLIIRPFDLFLTKWVDLHNFVGYIVVVQECWDNNKVSPICKQHDKWKRT